MAKERRDKKNRILGKGEYQYSNGRYEYTYTDANGVKQKVYSWCLNETDKPPKGKTCDKCLRILEREIARNVDCKVDFAKGRKLTLDELFEKHIKLRPLRDSTRTNYKYIYKKFISPAFGKRIVSTIVYSDIVEFYTDLINVYGFKPNSMEVIHTILHPIFTTAVRDHIMYENPTDKVMSDIKKRYDWEKPKRRALTEEQQSAFIDFVNQCEEYKNWLPIITVLLGTGCRIGEVVGLRWEDCDFDDDIISINHTLIYRQQDSGKCEYHISIPKTKAGIREIPMFKDVKRVLIDERKRQMREGFNKTEIDGYGGFIFSNRYGFVQSPHNVNRALNRICRDYNNAETEKAKNENRQPVLLPHFSNHNLRHTFCTRFCENETNIKIIQEIMGHADITTTMDVYNEATTKKKKESFAALEGKIKIS